MTTDYKKSFNVDMYSLELHFLIKKKETFVVKMDEELQVKRIKKEVKRAKR